MAKCEGGVVNINGANTWKLFIFIYLFFATAGTVLYLNIVNSQAANQFARMYFRP